MSAKDTMAEIAIVGGGIILIGGAIIFVLPMLVVLALGLGSIAGGVYIADKLIGKDGDK